MGYPDQHPFYKSSCTQQPPNAAKIIRSLSQETIQILATLTTKINELSAHLKIATPQNLRQLDRQLINAQILLRVPNLYEVDLHSALWPTEGDALVAGLQAGLRIHNHKLTYGKWLIPEAWTQNVIQIRQGLMSGPKIWRTLSGRYRAAKQELTGLCRRQLPKEWEEQIGAVDAILEVQRVQPHFQKVQAYFPALFGIRWQGDDSNWEELIHISEWLTATMKDIQNGQYPAELLAYASKGVQRVWLGNIVAEIRKLQGQYTQSIKELLTFLEYQESTVAFLRHALQEQETSIKNIHGGADRFQEIIQFNKFIAQFSEASLDEFWHVVTEWEHASTQAVSLFKYVWFVTLIEKAEISNALFNDLTSAEFHITSERYQQLDKQFLIANRHKLATAHWKQLPRYKGWGQMGVLQAEMGKKRSHKPIRHLMQQAGQAIQLVKPVFMMSPLSIAAYLPPGSVEFDLVIFDEASQVRPIEAFGAILRGKQVVVVGDSKQLPPTMFFENITPKERPEVPELDNRDDDHELHLLDAVRAKNESILDLFTAQNAPKRMLRWHYRSQHESLIAISNRAFYDRQLIIFPSPDRSRKKSGLQLRYHPNTIYERGGSRTNPEEATIVAHAVLEHAQNNPQLSLGVVTFSTSQRNAIRRKLEHLRRADPTYEDFFKENENEPFFIKNLENVQGDERDVIFISVGYGRTANGRMSMNFGPLNQQGGERRLNVLITRSRQKCALFCNFTADDIDLSRTKSEGVAVLKEYLQYAQTGTLPVADYNDRSHPITFENFVTTTLSENGFQVTPKVGAGQMRLDIGVVDEENDDFYRAGINSDHSPNYLTFSCRDRERIQKEVLSRLGWKTINILSHSWWHNLAEEKARLINQIETTSQLSTQPTTAPSETLSFERYTALEKFNLPRPIPEYEMAYLEVDEEYKELYKLYQQANERTSRFLEMAKKDGSLKFFYDEHFQKNTSLNHIPQIVKDSVVYEVFHTQSKWRNNCRDRILQLVKKILDLESPIHITEIIRRLSYAAGYKKYASSVARIESYLIDDLTQAQFARDLGNSFFGNADRAKALVRNRENTPKVSRKFEYIHSSEIDEAVIIIVHDSVAIEYIRYINYHANIHLRAGQLFGFRQIGERSRAQIDDAIKRLLAQGVLVKNGDLLSLNRKHFDPTYLLAEPYHSNV